MRTDFQASEEPGTFATEARATYGANSETDSELAPLTEGGAAGLSNPDWQTEAMPQDGTGTSIFMSTDLAGSDDLTGLHRGYDTTELGQETNTAAHSIMDSPTVAGTIDTTVDATEAGADTSAESTNFTDAAIELGAFASAETFAATENVPESTLQTDAEPEHSIQLDLETDTAADAMTDSLKTNLDPITETDAESTYPEDAIETAYPDTIAEAFVDPMAEIDIPSAETDAITEEVPESTTRPDAESLHIGEPSLETNIVTDTITETLAAVKSSPDAATETDTAAITEADAITDNSPESTTVDAAEPKPSHSKPRQRARPVHTVEMSKTSTLADVASHFEALVTHKNIAIFHLTNLNPAIKRRIYKLADLYELVVQAETTWTITVKRSRKDFKPNFDAVSKLTEEDRLERQVAMSSRASGQRRQATHDTHSDQVARDKKEANESWKQEEAAAKLARKQARNKKPPVPKKSTIVQDDFPSLTPVPKSADVPVEPIVKQRNDETHERVRQPVEQKPSPPSPVTTGRSSPKAKSVRPTVKVMHDSEPPEQPSTWNRLVNAFDSFSQISQQDYSQNPISRGRSRSGAHLDEPTGSPIYQYDQNIIDRKTG